MEALTWILILWFVPLALSGGISLGTSIIKAGNWIFEGMDIGIDKKNPH